MKTLLDDILEIPARVRDCLLVNQGVQLPENVPYLGMGASYNAALTVFGCGKNIYPELASEYYYRTKGTLPLGVLISQSGETSETLWCLERFQKIITITNHPQSALAVSPQTQQVFEMRAGQEEFASTKTYITSLLVLYMGLGIDTREGTKTLEQNIINFQKIGKETASKIADSMKSNQIKGLFVLGSGPNRGTALEGALTLTETTKRAWIGMSVAEFDHGPKEAANDSVIIFLNANGKDAERIRGMKKTLKEKSNALAVELAESHLTEVLSPFSLIVQLNFIMAYLEELLQVRTSPRIGHKVTRVL